MDADERDGIARAEIDDHVGADVGGACQHLVEGDEIEGRIDEVRPIKTVDTPGQARRPLNCRLDCGRLSRLFGVHLPSWEEDFASSVASGILSQS